MGESEKKLVYCPICLSSKFNPVFSKKWQMSSFVKCKKCDLIFQNPQENKKKTELRYDKKYFQYEVENQDNFFNLVKKTLDDYNIINILPEKARVLEIGSATGLFLQYMDLNGFESVGVELCKESVVYGKKEYGANLLHGKLEDMSFSSDEFDFIHFSHLIEHLNNPTEFINIVYRILKKNGLALLTTPNSSGLFSNYYGELWRCIVDDHLFLFNKKNLKMLLVKKKFKIIKNLTWGSIPAGIKNKKLKKIIDWIVKKSGTGDVVSFLVQKI